MFEAGTRYAGDGIGQVAIQVERQGTLRMPSGRLVAADPGWLDEDTAPLVQTVAPGEYPILLAVAAQLDDPENKVVVGAKVVVAEEPVVTWELGLLAGQDLEDLGDGQFYGVGVDTGMVCFFDAAATPVMIDRAEGTLTGELVGVVDDPAGNLIAFRSGWGDGSYPVWVGRTADGQIGCFVADMLVLRHVSRLEPVRE
jgi:hypothetical protein